MNEETYTHISGIEKENRTESFELRNDKDEVIATSHVTMQDLGLDDRERRRFLLTSWTLEGASGIQVDVFDLLKPGEPIYITEGLERFHYAPDKGYVEIPQLSSLENIAIAFHEVGHMKQNEEEFFQRLTEMARDKMGRKPLPGASYWPDVKKKLFGIKTDVPVKDSFQLNQGLIDKLDQAYEVYNNFFESIEEEAEENSEREEELNREQNKVEKQFYKILQDNEVDMKNFINYPQIILERNATKRALVWLRTLRDKHHISIVQNNPGVQFLKKALKTYYYEKKQQ